LEDGDDGGNHSNVLVGARHHLWHHVVLEEQWTEDHAAGDTSESAQSCCNRAEYRKFNDLAHGLELEVVWRELVAILLLFAVDAIDTPNL